MRVFDRNNTDKRKKFITSISKLNFSFFSFYVKLIRIYRLYNLFYSLNYLLFIP